MLNICYLNCMPYGDALALMEARHAEVVANRAHPGFLLVVQHPPTVTMGKRELLTDMRVPPSQLKYQGVAYYKIDRGGSVTVHEPGQVVIYPIMHMDTYGHSVRSYVCALEEAMIQICAHYGVVARRDPINPGVWVKENKIGAVGIRVLNKVTKHGLAFNVTNTLGTFSTIVPCGIRGRGVTRLQDEVLQSSDINYAEVEKYLANCVQSQISIRKGV